MGRAVHSQAEEALLGQPVEDIAETLRIDARGGPLKHGVYFRLLNRASGPRPGLPGPV